jgi:hypothetical protein
MAKKNLVTVHRFIPADASAIFDLLADPRKHNTFDGSGTVQLVKSAPARLSLGATFSMLMKNGSRYTTKNRVVVFEENRTIAWHHFAQFIWRYDLTPVEGGTDVTESFDYNKPWGFVIKLFGWPEKNRRNMAATLERIEQLLTTTS